MTRNVSLEPLNRVALYFACSSILKSSFVPVSISCICWWNVTTHFARENVCSIQYLCIMQPNSINIYEHHTSHHHHLLCSLLNFSLSFSHPPRNLSIHHHHHRQLRTMYRIHHVHHMRDLAGIRAAVLCDGQSCAVAHHNDVGGHQSVGQRDARLSLHAQGKFNYVNAPPMRRTAL